MNLFRFVWLTYVPANAQMYTEERELMHTLCHGDPLDNDMHESTSSDSRFLFELTSSILFGTRFQWY